MGAVLSAVLPSALWAVVAVVSLFMKPPMRPVDLHPPLENQTSTQEQKLVSKGFIENARRVLGMDCIKHYNFAVCGESGTGKSSFINGIRLVEPNGRGAAKIGVTETTHEITSYPHPEAKHIVVWDLPGAGTLHHPSETYFDDKKLYAFDCILIISADRFRKVEFDIARVALRYGKPIAFVRNKADISIKELAEERAMPADEAAKELRDIVGKSFDDNLMKAGLITEMGRIPLFIVSSKWFIRPTIYHIQDEECDKSLQKMDERKLFDFLLASVKPRMRPSLA